MKKKFIPKFYQNKDRVFSPVPSYPSISKLWKWNSEKKEYECDPKSKSYQARKYITSFGTRTRVTQFFYSLAEARNWQVQSEKSIFNEIAGTLAFGELIESWRKRVQKNLSPTTKESYEKIIRCYFQPLLNVPMTEFNERVVENWVDYLLDLPRTYRRFSFEHEIGLLGTLLNYHQEYEPSFRNPIKKRHKKALKIKPPNFRKKDLSEQDFLKFSQQLKEQTHGQMFVALATVQFYHALRISEAAALHWEDVSLGENGRINICRSVKWTRKKGERPFIEANYKNARANQGAKESPLFPRSASVLKELGPKDSGLVFTVRGEPLTYRQIQNAYDSAFLNAGLPYSGTHIMRHGGCRRVFDQNGDVGIAQQILGNRDMRTVFTYAQRSTRALNDFAQKEWDMEKANVATTGYKEEKAG